MATFDSLVQEIGERYCLGPKARLLVDETRRSITKLPGGARGFIEKCKAAGFSVEVASWLKGSDPIPLSGEEAEQTLGTEAVSRIAAKAGVSQCFARTVLGYAIPKAVLLLARGGALPAAVRAAASRLMRAALRRDSVSRKETATHGKVPARTLKAKPASAGPVLGGLVIPATTMLLILGLVLGYFIGLGEQDTSQAPLAPVQIETATTLPPAATSGRQPLGNSYAAAPVAGNGRALPGAPFQPLSGQNASNQAGPQKLFETKFPVVFFAPNRAAANAATRPLLPRIAHLIKQLPKGTVVEIAGYTDSAGRPIANMRLSQKRADAIRGALVRAGTDPSALAAKGYGVFHPAPQAGENGTVEGRSYSLAGSRSPNGRRVEFRVSQGVSPPASSSRP